MAANANDLSSAFNAVKERVSNFSTERQNLVQTLEGIIRSAQQLLGDLADVGGGRAGGRGRKRGPGRPAGRRRRRRNLSPEARARIAAAQRARWARHRAGKK
jgi:hypothetical protein